MLPPFSFGFPKQINDNSGIIVIRSGYGGSDPSAVAT